MRLPEPFAERMRRELGAEEAERLFVALNDEPSVAVRLNPRKAMAEKWGGRGVPWSRDGYVLAERPSFTLDPDFHAGAYYVQEAASQFAGYILAEAAGGAEACRGMRVLDMCAAPGGKSTHYASLVGREGLVVANEINRGRAAVLADNARKWGAGNMVVACNDSARVAAFEEWFDAVAVDAPCSGEGMFRKSEEACAQWSEAGDSAKRFPRPARGRHIDIQHLHFQPHRGRGGASPRLRRVRRRAVRRAARCRRSVVGRGDGRGGGVQHVPFFSAQGIGRGDVSGRGAQERRAVASA